jgi:molybdenum cofactor guanylyltransferase
LTPVFDPEVAMGFVLAGGRSSRMGRDKALVSFGDQSLVARALSILRAAGLQVGVAGTRSALDVDEPVFLDSSPDQGPLSGVCVALSQTKAEWTVFLPVDMPLMPASLLDYMLRNAIATEREVTVLSVCGFAQTFPAVLHRAALPSLMSSLQSGERGCYRAFKSAAQALGRPMAALPVETLAVSGQVTHPGGLPAARWLVNVNTPADLEHAGAFLRGRFA